MDPRINLGIDNCFAIKRWTTPSEWIRVIREMGIKYIECVPDLENDPLLMEPDYRREWIEDVKRLQQDTGVRVVILYSNNATYDTTGLAHPDERVRRHIIEKWFRGFMETAASLGADIGYYVQAFPEEILFDKTRYDLACGHMLESLIKINRMAMDLGVCKVSLEQMYTPHQIPFTIEGMKALMQNVQKACGKPLYVTEDVGHHCKLYLKPTGEEIKTAHHDYLADGFVPIWLGSRNAYSTFTRCKEKNLPDNIVADILQDIDENSHLFNAPRDTDCYEWLAELGCYSPVIHLQQTDGTFSAHHGFTMENNSDGIIQPVRLLQALQKSYERPTEANMPPRCDNIYLMLELYLSTAEIGYQGLHKISQSVEYLRRFIPRDGMRLSELLALHS